MDITSTTREGIVFLATKGDLDMYAAPEFKERYSALASRDRRAHFILDLAETHYVDSSGIGAIFQVFSDVRSPENNINPAIARSRSERKLPNNAAVSSRSRPRGNRRGSRTRSRERDFGRSRCANNPPRCPVVDRRAAADLGTGLTSDGSRIARNSNSPEIAAIRRLIVDGAYPVDRPVRNGTTFPPA